MSKQIEIDNAGGGVHYYGEAPLGTATTAVGWTLKRMTIASNDLVVEYPIGSTGSPTDEGEFKWADRATLNYSLIPDVTVPTMSSAARDTNTQITITMSEAMAAASVTNANDGGFVVTRTGEVDTYAVSAVAAGASANLVVLTVADMDTAEAEGVTVTYATGGNATATDVAGNALATDATGEVIATWAV